MLAAFMFAFVRGPSERRLHLTSSSFLLFAGRVTLWTMSKNELQYTDVMELKLAGIASRLPQTLNPKA